MSISFYWIISGIILCIIETILPIAYFLWFGIACFVLSALTYVFNFSDVFQAVIYAIISPAIVLLGRHFVPVRIKDRHDKNINKKIQGLMGKKITLENPLTDVLQIKIEETLWIIKSQNQESLDAGTVVEIVDFENNRLLVRKL
ncbi:MAG: Inner membrane protein YbbJ [Holosporales bacterium]